MHIYLYGSNFWNESIIKIISSTISIINWIYIFKHCTRLNLNELTAVV